MYSPSSFQSQLPEEFAVYDLETTGVDTQTCEITEIGVALVKKGVVTERWSSLVKTCVPISEEVEKITGITNAMVEADGIELKDALEKFFSIVSGHRVIGHNILRYDNPILERLMVVDLLKEKGLQFEKVDVSQNTTKAKESIKISGQMGVPVLDVDGKIVVG